MVTIDIQERSIKNIKLIPYEQCQHNVVQVILMKAEKKDAFLKNIDFLNSLIKDDEKLNNSFLQFLNEKEKNYLSAFSPYSNRYLRYLCKHRLLPSFFTISRQLELINYIECESHRDMILCSLKNNKCHES
jgi:poly-gamma-glutamate synthesis protein (capsule biosynthesis protein)